MKFNYRIFWLIFISVLYLSCDSLIESKQEESELEADLVENIEEYLSYFDGGPYSEQIVVQRQERLLNELSELHENFGGIWFDSEDPEHLIIATSEDNIQELKSSDVFNEIKAISLERITTQDLHKINYRFSVKNVKYTFRELQYVRDLLVPKFLHREGIAMTKIDIENNVFSIGITEDVNRNELNNLISTLEISEDIISFFNTEKIIPFNLGTKSEGMNAIQSNCTNYTVQDYFRPLTGGLQIHNPTHDEFSDLGLCTFGFNVKLNGVEKWITNSHCTDTFSNTGSSVFYQSQQSDANSLIGTEFRDNSGTQIFSNLWRRYSDSALIQKQSGVSSEFGKIASSCQGRSGTWNVSGGLTIGKTNSSMPNDYFEIVDDNIDVLVNMPLNKVGRTTGWTFGYVTNTCADISFTHFNRNWWMACQITNTMYAEPGDSGSPVFYWPPGAPLGDNNVSLVGIYWGSHDPDEISFISHISAVKYELTTGNESLTTY